MGGRLKRVCGIRPGQTSESEVKSTSDVTPEPQASRLRHRGRISLPEQQTHVIYRRERVPRFLTCDQTLGRDRAFCRAGQPYSRGVQPARPVRRLDFSSDGKYNTTNW